MGDYLMQGPEVTAIHDAIANEHRNGGFIDCGRYMETARRAVNNLTERGYSIVPNSKWLVCADKMPEPVRKYWITDGKDVALAEWRTDKMQWRFLYHYSVFVPTHMLPVKLPKLVKDTPHDQH
ncbi:MAG: hypothetical protein ACK5XN_30750 [Bacteroidota bacterium]